MNLSRTTARSVTVLHPSNEWYGSDRMLAEFAFALRSVGTNLHVLLPPSTKGVPSRLERELRAAGCRVTTERLPALRRKDLTLSGGLRLAASTASFLHRFARAVSRNELIVLNTSALAHLCPPLKMLGFRVAGYVHEIPAAKEAALLGAFWAPSNGLLAISQSVKTSLPKRIQDKVRVILNCTERVREVPLPSAPPLKFVFVGRLTPRKGVRELVDCFAQLDRERYHLTVVGAAPALGIGVDTERLFAAMHNAGVSYLGELDDPSPTIHASHALVAPSLLPEGLGLTAVESLAHGRPVVATTVAGLSEVVDGEVGWGLDPNAPHTWTETFEGIDIAGVRLRTARCVPRFEKDFSREAYAAQVIDAVGRL